MLFFSSRNEVIPCSSLSSGVPAGQLSFLLAALFPKPETRDGVALRVQSLGFRVITC